MVSKALSLFNVASLITAGLTAFWLVHTRKTQLSFAHVPKRNGSWPLHRGTRRSGDLTGRRGRAGQSSELAGWLADKYLTLGTVSLMSRIPRRKRIVILPLVTSTDVCPAIHVHSTERLPVAFDPIVLSQPRTRHGNVDSDPIRVV